MLETLVSVILIVGCIWLAVIRRWFRWVLGCIAVVLILCFANSELSRKREEEAAKHRISLDQVQFTELCLAGAIPQRNERIQFTSAKTNPPLKTLSAADRCYLASVVDERIKRGDMNERQLPNARAVLNELSMLDPSAHSLLTHSKITGRIRNSSPTYKLRELTLQISVQDCAAPERDTFVSAADLGKRFKAKYPRMADIPSQKMVAVLKLKQVRYPEIADSDLGALISETYPVYANQIRPENALQTAARVCETVGQATVTSFLDVPPMQSRAYDQSVSFTALPEARGTYQWNFRIILLKGGIEAK